MYTIHCIAKYKQIIYFYFVNIETNREEKQRRNGSAKIEIQSSK